MKNSFRAVAVAAAALMANAAYAGPFIIAGTDADDHGSANATQNFDGWLFMQKSLENIGAAITGGAKIVYSLGSDMGTEAGNAATSAFTKSSLASNGWTFQSVNGAAAITTFLQGSTANGGILMLDSGTNVSGGISSTESTALTANASFINSFVGAGGGLFSQANDLGWLSALVPSLTVAIQGSQGLALTAAGNAAFPGLTNADLSSGPYHASFGNVGALPVLARGTGSFANLDVILGSSGGSITVPVISAVPEPETYAMMLAGLGLVGAIARRRKSKQSA